MTDARSEPDVADEAEQVAQAVERLFAGTAYRSSGRLSVVALAEEAGLKRTRLYEHHRQQVDAFAARIGRPSTTASTQAVEGQLRAARAKIAELEAEAAAQAAKIRTLMATVVELSLQLDPRTNVMPMRPTT